MYYYDIILSSYGWQGLTLVGVILLLFSIQIFYYAFRFRRLGNYLNKNRASLHEERPSVSLVIPMFSEDYAYIEDTLPLLLTQTGVEFELVIVYVGCDNDFFDDMLQLKAIFPNVVVTKIERNDRFPISVKTALNIGIKASRHEHIVFTTTDAHPTSQKWLSLMAQGFQRGDVVLGYCGMECEDNRFDSYFIRATRLMESMTWLSKAIMGVPYRGIRSNIGFTKSLYFGNRGFNRLNMNIGEDDLFMQAIMKNNNASVVLSPRATVLQKGWGRMGGMIDNMRFYGSAEKFYPAAVRNFMAWEPLSRSLLFVAGLIGMIFLPFEISMFILILLLIRLWVVLSSVSKVAGRVGEEKIVGRYIFYDLLSPLFTIFMHLKMIKRDERVWR